MNKFNPKMFDESHIVDSSSRRPKNTCKGILRGLKYMVCKSPKFYIFLGLFILNLCK